MFREKGNRFNGKSIVIDFDVNFSTADNHLFSQGVNGIQKRLKQIRGAS